MVNLISLKKKTCLNIKQPCFTCRLYREDLMESLTFLETGKTTNMDLETRPTSIGLVE